MPTYAYEFNDENAPERFLPSVGFPYGATHAAELQYLFGLPTRRSPAPLAPRSRTWRRRCSGTGRTFATVRRPRPAARPGRGSPRPAQTLSLVPPRPQVETDFAAEHQCAFWASLAG